MTYIIETPRSSVQTVNAGFINKLSQGLTKEAEQEATAFIRAYMKEESAYRSIMLPRTITEEDLDRDESTDQPKVIIEKEPESVATFVPFQGTPPRRWFKGNRFAVYFGKIVTDDFTKDKWSLMTYKVDIRKVLADNGPKDMADQEDTKCQVLIDAIITGNAAEQRTSGAFNSTTFKNGWKKLLRRRRPLGKMLMTQDRYMDAVDLPATSVGDDVASKHYYEGVGSEEVLWGIPVVTSIKTHVFNEAKAFIFSPEEYLGKFYLLQDATLFIETKADIISWYSYEVVGVGIGNTLSVQEIAFTS